MSRDVQNPQINSAKIPVAGNIAGVMLVLGAIGICFTGIPLVRILLPAAAVVGVVVALVLHFAKHKTLGAAWIPK